MAVCTGQASAGLLVTSADNCGAQPLSHPFAPWGDNGNYTPLPGSFEPGEPGWTLDRAAVIAGNEPFRVHGAGDSRSLRLSPGGVATSRTICVGLEHPTLRFFARGERKLLSTLSVEVITQTSLGLKLAVPLGVVLPSGEWRPSQRFLVVANLLPLLPHNLTPVAFRFRAVGAGTWWIDDVYVDPMRRV
jgi:hypothetical protein